MAAPGRSKVKPYRGWFAAALLFGALAFVSRPTKNLIGSCAQQIDNSGNPVGPSCTQDASAGFYVAGIFSVALFFQGIITIAKN